MVITGAAPSGPETAGTSEVAQSPRDPQRRLLRAQERLLVADAAARVPALEGGVDSLHVNGKKVGEDPPVKWGQHSGSPLPHW
jgi:hypothetical protein